MGGDGMADRNVFDWLEGVRARPDMYVGDEGLSVLETLLHGYYAALHTHGIVEGVPSMGHHFLDWLYHGTGWSCSCGWAYAITMRYPDRDEALAVFFGFVDAYRLLRPTRLCTVELGPDHEPTGRRVVIGMDGRMEKPLRVDVIRYLPEPLHFLRFHYEGRVEDDNLLMTGTGDHGTTIDYAKRWVLDELQVGLGSWKRVDARTGKVEG
jgi:hypothetical protein